MNQEEVLENVEDLAERLGFWVCVFAWLVEIHSPRSPKTMNKKLLGGGFKHFLFSLLFGENSHFD